MKISIIHATTGRPEQAAKTAFKWLSRADNKVEYIVSLNGTDKDDYSTMTEVFKQFNTGCIMRSPASTTAISAFNEGFRNATGDILIAISDDTSCPEFWDTLLRSALQGKTDFCAKTDDGLQPTLITMPLMDRIYYERYGYVYHPDYKHMFADQELTTVAKMTGKFIQLPLKFEHLHYSTGKSPKDEINVLNDLSWKQGEKLFNERLKTNFEIAEPVMPYSEIQWR